MHPILYEYPEELESNGGFSDDDIKSSYTIGIHIIIYMRKARLRTFVIAQLLPVAMMAQYAWQENDSTVPQDLGKDIEYKAEVQTSVSHGKTPLWLNANKYGLSSLSSFNGYVRGSLIRPLSADSARRWGVGYGVDMAVPLHYTSHFVLQQAFVEARWLHGVLSVGAKEYPMELKNQTLSSGSQTLGINARPVPQVRLALPEYWTIPILGRWFQFKGHVAFGVMTDGRWQEDFTQRRSKYVVHTLYHSKAGYLRIGNKDRFFPLSVEIGLEMAAEFGGRAYRCNENGEMVRLSTGTGLKDYFHAFIPSGSDVTDGEYANVEGNHLGSWLLRVNYDADTWRLGVYADHFFEDHSQMFFVDYDGYGEGEEWMKRKKNRYYRYKLKDIMLGAEVNIKYGTWLRNVVFEYLYTKYQSGPYNHDHTMNIPDHLAGTDDYYNHGIYAGWQHWGQVMGNPLYRSPQYNDNGVLYIYNNRFIAFHLGFDGRPTERLGYRVLATYQKGWGTYSGPFSKPHHNVSFLLESDYTFRKGWFVKGGYAMDFGSEKMLGHNAGFQLTVGKSGVLNIGKRRR